MARVLIGDLKWQDEGATEAEIIPSGTKVVSLTAAQKKHVKENDFWCSEEEWMVRQVSAGLAELSDVEESWDLDTEEAETEEE